MWSATMQVHVLHLAPAQALGTEWVQMSRTSELMGRVVAGSGGEALRGQSARGEQLACRRAWARPSPWPCACLELAELA